MTFEAETMKPDNFTIRKANLDEGKCLSELTLRSKAYWGFSQEFLNKCRPHLVIDEKYISEWIVRVLETNEELVGYFSLKVIGRENRLDNLWLEPKFIRKGYGSILLRDAIQTARKIGWSSFRMAVDDHALEFYEKKGAKVIGQVQSRLGKDIFLNHVELGFERSEGEK